MRMILIATISSLLLAGAAHAANVASIAQFGFAQTQNTVQEGDYNGAGTLQVGSLQASSTRQGGYYNTAITQQAGVGQLSVTEQFGLTNQLPGINNNAVTVQFDDCAVRRQQLFLDHPGRRGPALDGHADRFLTLSNVGAAPALGSHIGR
jgi:hypothetical protein